MTRTLGLAAIVGAVAAVAVTALPAGASTVSRGQPATYSPRSTTTDPGRPGVTDAGATSPCTRIGGQGIGTISPAGPGSGHAASQPLSSYPGSVQAPSS